MTPFQRFCRKLYERLRDRYYEGPDPPPRLHDEVRVFAALNPQATASEWKDFAARHADVAYRDGFTRGLEWNERLWPGPAEDPEVVAEREAHAFSLPEHYLQQLERQPPSPVQGMAPDDALRLQHQLARAGARLVPDPFNPYPKRG